MHEHFQTINYNVNDGNYGHGVKVAFVADGITTDHPTLDDPTLETPLGSGHSDPDSTEEGTMFASVIGGRIMNEAYGVAFHSDLEFVCCVSDIGSTPGIEFQEALRHLGERSTAYVVNYDIGPTTDRDFSGIDQAKCEAIIQNEADRTRVCGAGDLTFSFQSVVPVSGAIGTDDTDLELLYHACVAPVMATDRLCVFGAGDEGMHETGTMVSENGGVFRVEDLLDSTDTMLSMLDRNWLDNNLDERGSVLGLPGQDNRFEGHILVVAALDLLDDNALADYSNGCGEAMQYCLSAPGTILFEICPETPDAPQGVCSGLDSSNNVYSESGTEYAAALVSGALAVLRSTFALENAQAASNILLTTADDLGAADTDKVFGRGRLNMEAAFRAAGLGRTSAGVRLEDTHVKAGSSMDAALAATTASFGMQDMYGRHYLHFVTSRLSSSHLDSVLSFEDWQHSSSALMDMDFETRMGLSGSQRGLALPDDLGLDALSGWDMGLEQCHLSCPSRRDVQVGSLVESSALAWTQRHMQVPGGRMGLVLETGLEEDGGMTYTNRGLFAEASPDFGLIRIEAGMLDEKATFMGSEFSGALEVRPGNSQYVSASLGVPVGDNAFSAGYTFGKAKSGLVANSYVTEIQDVSYDAYRLAFGGERWELGYTVPLAARSGGIRIESIGGYTGSKGDWSIVETDEGVVVLGQSSAEDWSYRMDSHWIDLGAGSRERRLGLTMAKPYGNWDMTFALEHVANSPRASFAGNEARVAVLLSLSL